MPATDNLHFPNFKSYISLKFLFPYSYIVSFPAIPISAYPFATKYGISVGFAIKNFILFLSSSIINFLSKIFFFYIT
jgi:hypothetical protein